MKKKSRNIVNVLYPLAGIALILTLWQLLHTSGAAPAFALPAPLTVGRSFVRVFPLLMYHAQMTLLTAFIGLFGAIALAFVTAVGMDRVPLLYRVLYPLLVVTQTVPAVAIAPLLVLWFGYGMTPKVVLIVIVCFFPLAVGLLDAFRGADEDMLNLMRAMGANRLQIFRHAKLPLALPAFFSGLRIAVSYAIVGAVIAEWLGGSRGLGVFMTRVRRSFAFDQMFAVILLISLISVALIGCVSLLEKRCMPWKNIETHERRKS